MPFVLALDLDDETADLLAKAVAELGADLDLERLADGSWIARAHDLDPAESHDAREANRRRQKAYRDRKRNARNALRVTPNDQKTGPASHTDGPFRALSQYEAENRNAATRSNNGERNALRVTSPLRDATEFAHDAEPLSDDECDRGKRAVADLRARLA